MRSLRPLHALIGLALFSSLSLASCRDLVSGESVDVRSHLCERLTQCFGDEGEAACARLNATAPVTGEWSVTLRLFEPCLEGDCGVIRSCLDLPAFCIEPKAPDSGEYPSACGTDFDCCEATDALAACENSVCCRSPGAECKTDGECCGGLRCESNGAMPTCGGVTCTFVGGSCEADGDCCTGICGDDNTCTNIVCLQAGEACDGGCCGALECRGGVCAGPEECAGAEKVCNPAAANPCCDTDHQCLTGPNGIPTCTECGQEGFDCAQNSDCCSNACVAVGGSLRCAAKGCQAEAASPCVVSTDCCIPLTGGGFSAQCLDQKCVANTCETECHDPCVPGAALPIDDECNSEWASVIANVVEVDPFCGCEGWDSVCIGAFEMLGGGCL